MSDLDQVYVGALNLLFELEPEPDPEPCKCKPKWLLGVQSPEPDLYQQWECSHCGNRVIRGFPHPGARR